ncbi:MAG TPA: pantetheine-phosphate adenylyltransferase [Verrucomicrobiae bacterium]|nr:pantetheine-phosphate adenylyltransferase [Verrucomicrobiae bacterium]
MSIAIYPGTFDPVTSGHLDILERAVGLFDRVIIAVAKESTKQPLFSTPERVELLQQVTQNMPTVSVATFEGLTINYAKEVGAKAIIRGLRAMSDFEYEFQLALMNKKLDPSIETVFLMTKSEFSFISSSAIKWVVSLGGSVNGLVTPQVEEALRSKYKDI